MDFYNQWKNSMFDIEVNKKFTKRFLSKDPESLEVLKKGSTEELVNVCKFLLSIPINNFIYCIETDMECSTDMIIQYSNLNHAVVDVARVLKFNETPLTFSQLGKIIIKAKEDGACKKYGENHAKLAEELSMVQFERKTATEVTNTAFGDFSVSISEEDRTELIKRLAIRNPFIQKIIYHAKKGFTNYMELAMLTLSKSTALRRRANVRQVTYLILKDSELWNNIVW